MGFNIGEQEAKEGGRKPFFSKTFKTTAGIAAGKVSNERFIAEEDEWRHAPFDTIVITNLDVMALGIRLDSNPDNLIPVNQGQTIAGDNQNFRNFQVENLDSAVAHTAGKIRVLVQSTKKKGEN